MSKLYSILFNLIALSVIIYTGVDLLYRLVRVQLRQVNTQEIVRQQIAEIKHHKRRSLNDFQVILDRNIFGSLEKSSEETKATKIETLEPTSLKIALLGTVTGNKQNTVAVIEETDKKRQGIYKVGDSLQDAIVKMILRGKVVLRVGDRDEILTMEEGAVSRTEKEYLEPKPIGKGATIIVARSDLQKSFKNINRLLSQVRIRPHFKDGKADGLTLTQIKADSIFAKLGLKDGDIVQGINDRSIKSPDDVLLLYKRLRSGSQVLLQINRKGKQKTISYKFR